MRTPWILGILVVATGISRASALHPEPPCPAVFGGSASSLPVLLRTPLPPEPPPDVFVHRFQLATGTAANLEPVSLGPVTLTDGPIRFDSPPVPFPAVRAPTRFLVRWLTSDGRRLGSTEVAVYPTNLLAELAPLAGGLPVGLLDPRHQLRPRLEALRIATFDLTRANLAEFPGRLAIFGPFSREHSAPPDLAPNLKSRAERPLAAVWLVPSADTTSLEPPLLPSFHTVRFGQVVVVVAQDDWMRDLATNPRAQQTLIHLARHAVHPTTFGLPEPPSPHAP